jgi:hypothetical protein
MLGRNAALGSQGPFSSRGFPPISQVVGLYRSRQAETATFNFRIRNPETQTHIEDI